MTLATFWRALPRTFWRASFSGLIVTFVAAFLSRFSNYPRMLLRYGIDDPFGPLANVISNSFWIFVALCIINAFRRSESMRIEAMPAFLLTIQLYVGWVFTILLAGIWHSLLLHRWISSLPRIGTIELIGEIVMGQVLAYVVRRALFPKSIVPREARTSILPT